VANFKLLYLLNGLSYNVPSWYFGTYGHGDQLSGQNLGHAHFQDGGRPIKKNVQKAISRERFELQYCCFAGL